MSKKRDKEQLDRINATYDALFNDGDDMPIEEVRRALADAGIDRVALREALNARAKEIARASWAKGAAAPPALTRVIEQTGDDSKLPADPKRALDKAKQYMANLFGGSGGGRSEIVGAFRGEGELTNGDKATIDDIDAELRERVEAEDQGEPSED